MPDTGPEEMTDVDLFRNVPRKVIKQINRAGEYMHYPAGTHVATEGEYGASLHFITRGSAEVEVHGEKRPIMKPGTYFGEISLVDGKPRSATVIAGPDGLTTFAISHWAFKPILENNPTVAMAILQVLCARIRRSEGDGLSPR